MRHASLVLILAACGSSTANLSSQPAVKPEPPAKPEAEPAQPIDAAALIRAVAPAYRDWGRVDEEANFASLDCKAPPPPGRVRMSDAPESGHHGKLYFLYASDRPTYLTASAAVKPGFAIVKESFAAVARPDGDHGIDFDNRIKTVKHDGKLYGPGDPTGLFVMVKTDARDGTDAGWIYGTIVDGTVTSAGRVEKCMSCHEAGATHERLYGLKP